MKIRIAVSNDVKSISNLVQSLSHYYLKERDGILPQWFLATLTNHAFLERIESFEYLNYVIEKNNIIIGYISIKNKSHLYHLFVVEKCQGQGVARRLWEHAMSQCKNTIYTLRSSLYAVPIYKKLGFVELGAAQEKKGIGFQEMKLTL